MTGRTGKAALLSHVLPRLGINDALQPRFCLAYAGSKRSSTKGLHASHLPENQGGVSLTGHW
jgi:hypothetical protein